LVKTNRYDLVVMDIMMPELDGLSACREIRAISPVPVIMLSARGEEYDKISGFECGADDYVTKPFSPRELMLRVEVMLKRVSNTMTDAERYVDGGLVVDMTRRQVTVDGVIADLSPREYELLFYLVRHANTALSRDVLVKDVWGSSFEGSERTLDTHIKLLRRNLGAYAGHIVTLRGVGYRFDA
jgi:DNA-binding response OmpR family regulator